MHFYWVSLKGDSEAAVTQWQKNNRFFCYHFRFGASKMCCIVLCSFQQQWNRMVHSSISDKLLFNMDNVSGLLFLVDSGTQTSITHVSGSLTYAPLYDTLRGNKGDQQTQWAPKGHKWLMIPRRSRLIQHFWPTHLQQLQWSSWQFPRLCVWGCVWTMGGWCLLASLLSHFNHSLSSLSISKFPAIKS